MYLVLADCQLWTDLPVVRLTLSVPELHSGGIDLRVHGESKQAAPQRTEEDQQSA